MKKLTPARIGYISFATAKRRFGAQVLKAPALGQRGHAGRAEAGRAKHLERTHLNDGLLQSVDVFVGSTKKAELLVDGGQRLVDWIEKDDCPFEKLALVTYKVTGRTALEAYDNAAKLNRLIDSRVAARRSVDFYASAAQQVGVHAKSRAYKVGLRSGSFLRRALGPVVQSTDRELQELVRDELSLHQLMDELFAITENRHFMSAAQAQTLFSPGAQIGLFNYLSKRGGVLPRLRKTIMEGFLLAAGNPMITRKSADPASVALARVLARICSEVNYQAIRNTKRTDEGLYDTVGEQLKAALDKALRSEVKPKFAVAV